MAGVVGPMIPVALQEVEVTEEKVTFNITYMGVNDLYVSDIKRAVKELRSKFPSSPINVSINIKSKY